jgi:hypothetical protein
MMSMLRAAIGTAHWIKWLILSTRSVAAALLLRTGNSPLSAPELASGTIRAQIRKADELARNAHSILASTQKPRPTAISLWVRWSNTTYSTVYSDFSTARIMRLIDARRPGNLPATVLRRNGHPSFPSAMPSQLSRALQKAEVRTPFENPYFWRCSGGEFYELPHLAMYYFCESVQGRSRPSFPD